MSIIRHDDGSLSVTADVQTQGRDAEAGEDGGTSDDVDVETETLVIRPGEGGYVEALAEWESEQHPDQGEAVSTVSGRSEAMAAVTSLANDPGQAVAAVDSLRDRGGAAEALRHVLIGGTPSVEAFAGGVADAEGGELLAPHTMTGIIGELLAEIDGRVRVNRGTRQRAQSSRVPCRRLLPRSAARSSSTDQQLTHSRPKPNGQTRTADYPQT